MVCENRIMSLKVKAPRFLVNRYGQKMKEAGQKIHSRAIPFIVTTKTVYYFDFAARLKKDTVPKAKDMPGARLACFYEKLYL